MITKKILPRKSISSGRLVASRCKHSFKLGASSWCSNRSVVFLKVKRVKRIIKNAEKTAAAKYALSKFWLKYGSQAAKATSPAGMAPRIIRPMEATP